MAGCSKQPLCSSEKGHQDALFLPLQTGCLAGRQGWPEGWSSVSLISQNKSALQSVPDEKKVKLKSFHGGSLWKVLRHLHRRPRYDNVVHGEMLPLKGLRALWRPHSNHRATSEGVRALAEQMSRREQTRKGLVFRHRARE